MNDDELLTAMVAKGIANAAAAARAGDAYHYARAVARATQLEEQMRELIAIARAVNDDANTLLMGKCLCCGGQLKDGACDVCEQPFYGAAQAKLADWLHDNAAGETPAPIGDRMNDDELLTAMAAKGIANAVAAVKTGDAASPSDAADTAYHYAKAMAHAAIAQAAALARQADNSDHIAATLERIAAALADIAVENEEDTP